MPDLRSTLEVPTRGIALALGLFTAINLAVCPVANLWWIDVRPYGLAGDILLAVGALCLLAWAIRPPASGAWRFLILAATALLLVIVIGNAIQVIRLFAAGTVRPAVPLPASLLTATALAAMMLAMLRRSNVAAHRGHRAVRTAILVGSAAVWTLMFPVMQFFCFGYTDYRRPADAVVIFGARTYADGRLSDALADRVRTGVELYQQGWAPRLIMSGGPGDGSVHETEAMSHYAESLGVPSEAILLDPGGVNTHATTENTRQMMQSLAGGRVLAVSHFYHLPRIKLACQQMGYDVYTVPAKERYTLTALPVFLAREVAAWWWYYARPVIS